MTKETPIVTEHFIRWNPDGSVDSVIKFADGKEHAIKVTPPKVQSTAIVEIGVKAP